MSDSVWPHRRQPNRLCHPWDSPGKNTGVGCRFLLQQRKMKSESEVAQSCPTLRDPTDCSPPGSSICGIFQARVLEWGAIAFSDLLQAAFLKSGFSLDFLISLFITTEWGCFLLLSFYIWSNHHTAASPPLLFLLPLAPVSLGPLSFVLSLLLPLSLSKSVSHLCVSPFLCLLRQAPHFEPYMDRAICKGGVSVTWVWGTPAYFFN